MGLSGWLGGGGGRPSLLSMLFAVVVALTLAVVVMQFATLSRGGRGQNDQEVMLLQARLERLEESQRRIERDLRNMMPGINERLHYHNSRLLKAIKGGDPNAVLDSPTLNTNKTEYLLKWVENYTIQHKLALAGKRKDAKYLMCVGHNGYGNVFQSVMPCVLYGLVTNRVILINLAGSGWDHEDYFERPPINYLQNSVIQGKKSEDIEAEDLVCAEDASLFEHYEVLELTGSWGFDYFGQTIRTNPLWKDRLANLPANWYQILFRWLFRLKPRLQQRVDDFKAKFFGEYTIGIQIRTPILKTHEGGDFYKGKADHEGHPVPPINLYTQTAELLQLQQEELTGIPASGVVWFLATQNVSLRDELANRFGGHKIAFFEGKIITTFDSDKEGQEVAFLTWWILGECNDIVTTEASSYGITAAARAGIRAVVCNHGRFCARKLTPEPCQQTPWNEKGLYPVKPAKCPDEAQPKWRSVESSCAYFEAIIRNNPNYKKGNAW